MGPSACKGWTTELSFPPSRPPQAAHGSSRKGWKLAFPLEEKESQEPPEARRLALVLHQPLWVGEGEGPGGREFSALRS